MRGPLFGAAFSFRQRASARRTCVCCAWVWVRSGPSQSACVNSARRLEPSRSHDRRIRAGEFRTTVNARGGAKRSYSARRRCAFYRCGRLPGAQPETHASTVWDWLDTNAADAATSTPITTASAKNFMLCPAWDKLRSVDPNLHPAPRQRQLRRGQPLSPDCHAPVPACSVAPFRPPAVSSGPASKRMREFGRSRCWHP